MSEKKRVGWEQVLKDAQKNQACVQAAQKQRELEERLHKVQRMLFSPLIIGIAAAVAMAYYYGWSALAKNLLSWVIGITLVTTFVALVLKRVEK